MKIHLPAASIRYVLMIASFTMLSPHAQADAGLPMIAVFTPASLLAFFPVVWIEILVISKYLRINWRTAATPVLWANLLSTIVGIPLTWILLTMVEFIAASSWMKLGLSGSYPPEWAGNFFRTILTAPWLGHTSLPWAVPLATTTLLIPFFFISYWIESWYAAKMLYPIKIEKGRKAMWWANIASYSLLLLICITWTIHTLLERI